MGGEKKKGNVQENSAGMGRKRLQALLDREVLDV